MSAMRPFLLFAILLAFAAPTRADLAVKRSSTDEWGPPELVLRTQVRGWNDVQFALYASGRVLYRDRTGGTQPLDYLFVVLAPEEKRALLEGLAIDRVGAWPAVRSHCDDCATYCIDTWSVQGRKRDCVLGWPTEKWLPQRAAIWTRLLRFASPRATRWVPPQITVAVDVLSSSRNAPSSVEWPRQWPASGIATRDGWTFLLDGAALPDLRRVQAQRWDHDWGRLPLRAPDGRYVTMSFDYALPHQDSWRRE